MKIFSCFIKSSKNEEEGVIFPIYQCDTSSTGEFIYRVNLHIAGVEGFEHVALHVLIFYFTSYISAYCATLRVRTIYLEQDT